MITTGVTGHSWRASVTPWGAVHPWDGRPLEWYVAADDRWHVPAHEAAVRQRRLDGTAVVETRVRVPNGDAVQRVYSTADAGGVTVIEVENDSTLPIAVAFDRPDVLTERAPTDVPIEGIDLPAGSIVLPVGHRATARVGIAHSAAGPGRLPVTLPSYQQVVRGWLTLTERASRFVLPDGEVGASVAADVTAERCELALGVVPRADDDPAGFAVGLAELTRMGEDPDHWLPDLAGAVADVARRPGWEADTALEAAGRVLTAAGEDRALGDLRRITERRQPSPAPARRPEGIWAIPWLEGRIARAGVLLPDGMPTTWFGASVEVYGVPVGPATTVSFAIRWHGDRPAVLWEVSGPPIELSAPAVDPLWRTREASGEALWCRPPGSPAGGAAGDVSFA